MITLHHHKWAIYTAIYRLWWVCCIWSMLMISSASIPMTFCLIKDIKCYNSSSVSLWFFCAMCIERYVERDQLFIEVIHTWYFCDGHLILEILQQSWCFFSQCTHVDLKTLFQQITDRMHPCSIGKRWLGQPRQILQLLLWIINRTTHERVQFYQPSQSSSSIFRNTSEECSIPQIQCRVSVCRVWDHWWHWWPATCPWWERTSLT